MTDPDQLVREALGGDVTHIQRLSGGASRQTWAVDLRREGEQQQLVLQRERPGNVGTGLGMAGEAALLRAAHRAGVPVPRVVADGEGWVITERVEGETIARRILRDDPYERARSVLAGQCGRALARVHRIEPDEVPGLSGDDQLVQFGELLEALGEPHPALELGLRWLGANRPPGEAGVVVHGDFRNGNFVVGEDGLRAVLDWELAHLGDPIEDLGWICMRAWRFGGEPPVGGFGTREDLVEAYEAESGRTVAPEALRWWEALGTVRWGVICILQARAHLDGLSRSVELATIGRRVCETEHDLFLLLPGERPPPVAPTSGPVEGPHDRPTAGELAEAVREFLDEDVREATEGSVRFHARVAANAVAMVERELALGPAIAEAHRARLERLGFGSDPELAAAIRAGELDDRFDEVKATVWETVLDKLAVANPSYP